MKFKTSEELIEYVRDNCIIVLDGFWYFTVKVKELIPKSAQFKQSKNEFATMLWDELIPKDDKGNSRNKKQQGGYYFLPTKKDFIAKMTKFQAENNYPPDIISKAMKVYINEVYSNRIEMFTTLSNFISHKEKGSMLAIYCEAVISGINVVPESPKNTKLI